MPGIERVSCIVGLAFVAFGSAALAAPPKGAPAAAHSRAALERAVAQQPGDPAANKGKTEIQFTAESLDTIFSISEELHLREQDECFPCRQYLPFFLDLKN